MGKEFLLKKIEKLEQRKRRAEGLKDYFYAARLSTEIIKLKKQVEDHV